jgi:5'-3' exonuclease
MNPPILIVDGSFLLHRALHAIRASGEDDGGYPAVLSFLRTMRSSLDRLRACRKAVIVWDGGHSERRTAIFPGYKRSEVKERWKERARERHEMDFNRSKDVLHAILFHFGVREILLPGREGDDVISLSSRYAPEGSVVVSDDRDVLQLVSPSLSVYRPGREESVTHEGFVEAVGVARRHYVLFRALVGDPSDKVPGVEGVGNKTAIQVIEALNGDPSTPLRERLEEAASRCGIQKRFSVIHESWPVISRNMELMDLSLEVFSSDESSFVEERLSVSYRPDVSSAFQSMRALGYHEAVGSWSLWSSPFRFLL